MLDLIRGPFAGSFGQDEPPNICTAHRLRSPAPICGVMGCTIVLLNGPRERKINEALISACPDISFEVGGESLHEAKEIVEGCDLLISNDT